MSPLPLGRSHARGHIRLALVLVAAIGLVALAVGSVMATSTSNPIVYVGNPPSSPVPVTVTNQNTAQQVSGTVNVGNFPTTQAVSGTVNVGNLPATQDVHVTNSSITAGQPVAHSLYVNSISLGAGDNHTYDFGGTLNVREIVVDGQGNSDTFGLELTSPMAPANFPAVEYTADGTFTVHLDLAIPGTSITVICFNSVESCDGYFSVIGQ